MWGIVYVPSVLTYMFSQDDHERFDIRERTLVRVASDLVKALWRDQSLNQRAGMPFVMYLTDGMLSRGATRWLNCFRYLSRFRDDDHSTFRAGSFDPETISLLASALDAAWETVRKSGNPLGKDGQASLTREFWQDE